MRIAVIVVNYNTAELTIAAVQSVVEREHGGHDVRVHVVDNATPGDDAAQLAAAHNARGWGDQVVLYPETENHGFGRGNNVVLEALLEAGDCPDYAFLLNPDAKLENEALVALVAALEADPKAGAAGGRIVDETGAPVTAAFRFPSFASEVLRLADFGPLDKRWGHVRTSLPVDHAGGAVDWVSGAAVMFRMAALRQVGVFQPAFFLYFEEVELMHRLALAGWGRLYVPAALVSHDEGAATGAAQARAARRRLPPYRYHSWRIYFALTQGTPRAILLALAALGAGLFNHLQRGLRGKAPTVPPHFFGDHLRHALWPLLTGRGTKG